MFDRFPVRYLLPNAVTGLSIVMAWAAIVQGHLGNHQFAAWIIVWCVLLDRADGAVAGLVNARSAFGAQLDSLADFAAFCIAPAALVYFFLTDDSRYADLFGSGVYLLMLIVASLAYVLAGAVRLARFNVTSSDVSSVKFQGLSSTFAGFIVVTFLLSAEQHDWAFQVVSALPLILVVSAIFMVSNLPLPKSLPASLRSLFPVLVVLHAITYGLGIMRLYPLILFILALSYPVIGFAMGSLGDGDEVHHGGPAKALEGDE